MQNLTKKIAFKKICFTAKIFNIKYREVVRVRFKYLARQIFRALDLVVSEVLFSSIDEEKPCIFEHGYGTVELIKETYNMGYGLNIIIREAGNLANRALRKDAAKNDFNKAKAILARVLVCDEGELKGDGEPIKEEDGTISFYLERGDDQFFFRITLARAYTIQACFQRDYPFREISSDKFE